MSSPECEELRASAAELALGVLDGEERARLLGHACTCAACRAHLAELAVVAQATLMAAPAHEPPARFESRVLDAIVPSRARARRARRLLPALAVTATAAAASAAVITLSATAEERRLGTRYESVLATAGGRYLSAKELRDDAGRRQGVVFAYQGDQRWVTVVLSGTGVPRRVAIVTRRGEMHELGRFAPAAASRVWAHELPVRVRDVASVRLIGADGRELVARFPPRGRD